MVSFSFLWAFLDWTKGGLRKHRETRKELQKKKKMENDVVWKLRGEMVQQGTQNTGKFLCAWEMLSVPTLYYPKYLGNRSFRTEVLKLVIHQRLRILFQASTLQGKAWSRCITFTFEFPHNCVRGIRATMADIRSCLWRYKCLVMVWSVWLVEEL